MPIEMTPSGVDHALESWTECPVSCPLPVGKWGITRRTGSHGGYTNHHGNVLFCHIIGVSQIVNHDEIAGHAILHKPFTSFLVKPRMSS